MPTPEITEAFLKVDCELNENDEWDLPDEYNAALVPHTHSNPTMLYLPWPVAALPKEGYRVYLNSMPPYFDELVAGKWDYQHSAKEGVRVHVSMEGWAKKPFDLRDLLDASANGFQLESGKSIKEVLDEAGLKSLPDE